MNIILCLDDNNGMMFNNRRQSRDIKVIEDIITTNNIIFMNSYSSKLFENYSDKIIIKDNFLSNATTDDTCFVENCDITPFLNKISKITIYRWNRKYPFDLIFDPSILMNFKLNDSYEFVGNSHDKITKEVYTV